MAKRKRKMTIEDLFRLRVINQAAISPDGRQVAVSIKRCDPRKNKYFSNLYVVGSRGGRLRRLTSGEHSDVHPKWSPDGQTLAFVSNRDKATCIWLLPMDGGEPVRLTDRDHDVLDFDCSPDGRHIAYVARAKNERQRLERDDREDELQIRPDFHHATRLNYKLNGEGYWNGHYAHLYLIKTSGGTVRQLTKGDFDHRTPRFSPDGRRIAFLSNRRDNPDRHADNADLYTMPAGGGRATLVTAREGPIVNYSWSPDGRTFAYVGHFGRTGEWNRYNLHLWTIPATGGRARNLTPEVDNHCCSTVIGDVAELTFSTDPPLWSADGSRLFFTVAERGRANLYAVPARGGPVVPRLVGEHTVLNISRPAVAGPAALVVGTATNPGDVLTLDLDNAEAQPRQTTHVNRTALGAVHVVEPEPIACRRGGHTVHGWLMKPPGFSLKRKYPLIVQIHGGPHAQYGHSFFHELQWLAARGYVVLFANPRGSTGYGLKFLNALRHRWGVPDMPDVLACLDQVVRRGFVDRRRLYLTGGSYGGFMTNWIIGRDHRFRAAVTQRSVANMESMLASDFGWYLGNELGAMPWQDPQRYRRSSPLTNARRIRTPLLIIHSDQDLRCPLGQAEELYATLKYLGKEVELVCFHGESHELSRSGRPQNRAERLRRLLDWFERHR